MPDLPDLTIARRLALNHAVDLHREHFEPNEAADRAVTRTATALFTWLTGPVAMFLTFGPVLDQETGQPTGNTITGGSVAQLRDSQKVDISLTEKDAKGAVITDDPNLSWTSDNETVITVVPSTTPDAPAGTMSVVAGTVGSGVVKAQSGDVFITEAFDVVPGNVALMEVNVGTPTEQ